MKQELRDTTMDPIRQRVDEVLERAHGLQTQANTRVRATTAAPTWDGRPKVAWPARAS